MVEFEARLPLGSVDARQVAPVLGRLAKLEAYAPPDRSMNARAELQRAKPPTKSELLEVELQGFYLKGDKSEATERALPKFVELMTALKGAWFEGVEPFRLAASFDGPVWLFSFSKDGAWGAEALDLIETVVRELKLPVVVARESEEATHKNGLLARMESGGCNVETQLVENDVSVLLAYFREFWRVIDKVPEETAWSLRPGDGVEVPQAYEVFVKAGLPSKSLTLDLDFVPPELGLVPRFHELCVKPKDSFVLPVGTYAALPNLRGQLVIELSKKKGYLPFLVLEGEFASDADFPSRKTLEEAKSRLSKTLEI